MPTDRIKSTKWITKLESISDVHLRNHCMELLLVALQRKRLVGPFKSVPNDISDFQELNNYQPSDIGQLILKDEFHEYGKPPYQVEVSGDLKEYCAYQPIPNFGCHFYYAFSTTDTIRNWHQSDRAILPELYKQSTGPFTNSFNGDTSLKTIPINVGHFMRAGGHPRDANKR